MIANYDQEIEHRMHPENFEKNIEAPEIIDDFETHDLSVANEGTEQ